MRQIATILILAPVLLVIAILLIRLFAPYIELPVTLGLSAAYLFFFAPILGLVLIFFDKESRKEAKKTTWQFYLLLAIIFAAFYWFFIR